MKFALVGAHSSGKTTCLWNVGAELKKRGVKDFTLVQEVARSCPYPLNEGATFETDLWILLKQVESEMDAHRLWKHVICDRSVYDEMVYYKATVPRGKSGVNEYFSKIHFLRGIIDNWASLYPYDIIFLFRPLQLVDDPQRSKDIGWQYKIDSLFEDELIGLPNVIEVNQSNREERSEFVLAKIMERIKNE
ncbi:MAG: AAA family ATPase [Candidatus Babeliales bacterium]|jgi:hypothetical protein